MHLKKGSVIENVKYHYRDNLGDLITQADITDFNFSEDIRRTIELTEEVFGSLSAEELSDINHKQYCWKMPIVDQKDIIIMTREQAKYLLKK